MSNKTAAVPIFLNAPTSLSLNIFPTAPPKEKLLLPAIKANETERTSKPSVTYLRLRQKEKTFWRNRRFTPTTKKNVQIRKEARPKPLKIKRCETRAPILPNRL